MKADAPALMRLNDLRKSYRLRRGMMERLRGVQRVVTAVDGVSLPIERGSILGLVGESGCGKSTLLAGIGGLGLGDREHHTALEIDPGQSLDAGDSGRVVPISSGIG